MEQLNLIFFESRQTKKQKNTVPTLLHFYVVEISKNKVYYLKYGIKRKYSLSSENNSKISSVDCKVTLTCLKPEKSPGTQGDLCRLNVLGLEREVLDFFFFKHSYLPSFKCSIKAENRVLKL